jgi:hypothetical protein
MCSNPTRGFRRLLTSSYPDALSQVRGNLAIETVLEAPRDHEVPYSPKRHLSPHEIEQIVAGYLAGATARELGEKFAVYRTTVSAILKTKGVTMRRQPTQPEEIDQAIRLLRVGTAIDQSS